MESKFYGKSEGKKTRHHSLIPLSQMDEGKKAEVKIKQKKEKEKNRRRKGNRVFLTKEGEYFEKRKRREYRKTVERIITSKGKE